MKGEKIMSENEKKVFEQEVSAEELNMVSGGSGSETDPCVMELRRNIRAGKGFPNCAYSVEDGSWCRKNDACNSEAVVYTGMHNHCGGMDCEKAWS